MNGHGPYVWSAYGITFSAIFILLILFYFARENFFKQQGSIAKRSMQSAAQNKADAQPSAASSDTHATESSV
ncbi:hypothetical protein TDB9533_01165 [Thalassocella blandensis]|nr:hypothetical protein TDB9533_01165 [Thalassocella blandensis]